MLRRLVALALVASLAACGGGADDADGPTATVERPRRSSTTTEALTPEQEVEAAYLRSWKVYARAVRTLDLTGVGEVYAEKALETLRGEVERLRTEKRWVRVQVMHDLGVQILGDGRGVVVDRYQNHSVLMDGATNEPLEPDPNEPVVETYTLKEFDGSWKVVDFVRQ